MTDKNGAEDLGKWISIP